MKKLLLLPCLLFSLFSLHAQEKKSVFNHLDLSFTAGSTGLGFDLSMPAGEYLRVRTGATFMPKFEYKMRFNVQMVNGMENVDEEMQLEHFNNMQTFMKGFMGVDVSDHVDMIGSPRFHNFKLMVDVFPFKKKNWHATVGLYAGRSNVAKAYNTHEGMTSLLSVKMYNEMYWRVMNDLPIIEYNNGKDMDISLDMSPSMRETLQSAFSSYGTMAMLVGYFKEDYYAKQDILWDHDEMIQEAWYDSENDCLHDEEWAHRGDVRVPQGELAYKKGDPYRMLPDLGDNMVKVNAIVNKVRPYVGIGYSGALSKDKRSQISFDLGAMMWGGVPKMVTHDGIDLARDLEKLDGQVKRYINIAKKLYCFPVAELRFTQRIF